jgi:hypothetical protein
MTPSSVLVIKPSSLGDIVHTLPAVHFLKTTFRDADFYWIANSEWMPLLQDNADLKTVIPFPRSRFRGASGIVEFVRWCSEISHLKPDLVLDFQGLIRSAWIARSAKGAGESSVCRMPAKPLDITIMNASTLMPATTRLTVTSSWQDLPEPTPPGRPVFHFLEEERSRRSNCLIASLSCIRSLAATPSR